MHIDISKDIEKIITNLSLSESTQKGEVYTKSEVVDFMLDLIGYKVTEDLTRFTILEPSFGRGDFLKINCQKIIKILF